MAQNSHDVVRVQYPETTGMSKTLISEVATTSCVLEYWVRYPSNERTASGLRQIEERHPLLGMWSLTKSSHCGM